MQLATPGNNNRDCVIGTGSVICFLYHPYLVSFSFYAIPICPLSQNSQDFSFTCILSTTVLSDMVDRARNIVIQAGYAPMARLSRPGGLRQLRLDFVGEAVQVLF